MKNEFIPYEEALVLKELGFDEKCVGYYQTFKGEIFDLDTVSSEVCERLCSKDTFTKAPLYQQAFRWFREKYNLWVKISKHHSWLLTISDRNRNKQLCLEDYEGYMEPTNYEEAELACLKKLIEIVKQNKDEK